MHDREVRFYTKLFFIFLFLTWLLRVYLDMAGFKFNIPYVDAFLKGVWRMIGAVMKLFGNSISWHG